MSSGEEKTRETLNPYQANRLRVTCQYIDKILGEIEGILNTATSGAAFPRYSDDVLPAQRRTIEDYIARVRAQLVRVLDGQGIDRGKPFVPASRAVHVHLGAIDIAIEELKPEYMRGYGAVPEGVARELNGIVGELSALISRFDRYLSVGVGEDLKARVERLERTGSDLQLLKTIEEIVRQHGLIEFRPSITAILDRAEDKSFEIAVFGRVSSGKSSLLNAILETNALPVGVTPITAVPTRIVHGDKPSLKVWFSEAPAKTLDVAQLPEFATEEHNPGNQKHVSRLVLTLSSRRLEGGVSFVDTPGLGSLAASGAAETLAYLPKCDLGVMLIDAGSTLTADDLQTIMMLQQAAIPVHVLLSKADLLEPRDRERILRYVTEHIASECRLNIPVHPVSVMPSCRGMLDDWFNQDISPLYQRSQELRVASLRRKIGALRDSVAAALESRLNRRGSSGGQSRDRARAAEALLRKATGAIEEVQTANRRYAERSGADVSAAIADAAKRFLHAWSNGSYGVVVSGQLVRDSLTQFVHLQARKLQSDIAALATQLATALRQCAADLEIPDVPTEDEFRSLVRGAPVFESPSFSLNVSRPRVTGLLGERAVERSVRAQISRGLPPEFYTAHESYWQLAKSWSDSVSRQLKSKFEDYAESYRAQAEQLLGERQATEGETRNIQESLTRIRARGSSTEELVPENSGSEMKTLPQQ
jgi:GTP-binding protein EngB required for normal cell division